MKIGTQQVLRYLGAERKTPLSHFVFDLVTKRSLSLHRHVCAKRDREVPPLILRPLYVLYERHLGQQIQRLPLPRHIGIILDGNRRYARERRLPNLALAYQLGADRLDDLLIWCTELGVPSLTLWVFSTENLSRSEEETAAIFKAIETKLTALSEMSLIHERQIRVRAIGRLELAPQGTLAAIHSIEKATCSYDKMTLNIAVCYGGREEITDAVRTMLVECIQRGATLSDAIREISPESIARHLYTAKELDPDLIIRTSGEIRLSGFLLWQSVQSEFYFTDVLWPAFRKVDFLRAVRSYQQRKRRFGR